MSDPVPVKPNEATFCLTPNCSGHIDRRRSLQDWIEHGHSCNHASQVAAAPFFWDGVRNQYFACRQFWGSSTNEVRSREVPDREAEPWPLWQNEGRCRQLFPATRHRPKRRLLRRFGSVIPRLGCLPAEPASVSLSGVILPGFLAEGNCRHGALVFPLAVL